MEFPHLLDIFMFMTKNSEDKKEDISAAIDRGESVSSMEPLLIREDSRHRGELTDLAVDLVGKSAGFKLTAKSSGLLGRSRPGHELLLQQPHRGA